jgi:hypothetical protein
VKVLATEEVCCLWFIAMQKIVWNV